MCRDAAWAHGLLPLYAPAREGVEHVQRDTDRGDDADGETDELPSFRIHDTFQTGTAERGALFCSHGGYANLGGKYRKFSQGYCELFACRWRLPVFFSLQFVFDFLIQDRR